MEESIAKIEKETVCGKREGIRETCEGIGEKIPQN